VARINALDEMKIDMQAISAVADLLFYGKTPGGAHFSRRQNEAIQDVVKSIRTGSWLRQRAFSERFGVPSPIARKPTAWAQGAGDGNAVGIRRSIDRASSRSFRRPRSWSFAVRPSIGGRARRRHPLRRF